MLQNSKARDRLAGFLAREESAGLMDELEVEAASNHDRKRADLAAQLAAVDPMHEKAIAQASKSLEEADNRCIEARVRHVIADAKLREAWSLYHAAHAVRDNARAALSRQLDALAPEIIESADWTLAQVANYLRSSVYFDRSIGEREWDGSVPIVHLTNKPEIQLLLAEVIQARAKLVGMRHTAATFTTIRDTCNATLAEIKTQVVKTLPSAASEIGLIYSGRFKPTFLKPSFPSARESARP